MYHPTDRIAHTTAIVAPVVEHDGTKHSSMGPPRRIDPTTNRTMSRRSATVLVGKKRKDMFYLTTHSTHFIYIRLPVIVRSPDSKVLITRGVASGWTMSRGPRGSRGGAPTKINPQKQRLVLLRLCCELNEFT